MNRKYKVYFESLDDRVVPAAWEGLATLAATAADASSLSSGEFAPPGQSANPEAGLFANRLGGLVLLSVGPPIPAGGPGSPIADDPPGQMPVPSAPGANPVPAPPVPIPPPMAVASSGRGGLTVGWGGPSWLEAQPESNQSSITLMGIGPKPIVLIPPQWSPPFVGAGAPASGTGGESAGTAGNPAAPKTPWLDSAWHELDHFDDAYFAALVDSLRVFFGSTFQFPGRAPVTSGSSSGSSQGGGATSAGPVAKPPVPFDGGPDEVGDTVVEAAKSSTGAVRSASAILASIGLANGATHHDHPGPEMLLAGYSGGSAVSAVFARTELTRALRGEAAIGVLVNRFRDAINALLNAAREAKIAGLGERNPQAVAGGQRLPEGSARPTGGQGTIEASATVEVATTVPSLLACAVDTVAAVAPQFEEIVTRITPHWLAENGPLPIESSQWLDPSFDFGELTLEDSRNVLLLGALGGALWLLRPETQWNRKSRARWLSSVAAHDEVFANLGLEE